MTDVTTRSTVVGVFRRRADAERAIRDLRDAGFRDDQIGILTRDEGVSPGPAATAEGPTMAGEGAGVGAVLGGIAGAAAALLIPGVGPVLAGGILVGVLGGAAIGAAAGGIVGALVGMGIPEEEARYYEGEVRQGRSLVTVRADGRAAEARAILRRDGADGIRDQGTADGAADAAAEPLASAPVAMTPSLASPSSTEESVGSARRVELSLAEEVPVPRKHREQVGEVIIERRVVEEQRTIDVPVARTDVQVERVAADRPLAEGEPAFDEGGVMRIPIVEEEVIVTKRPRVVGEIVITRKTVTENRPITTTVRRADVEVHRTDGSGATGRDWAEAMPGFRSGWQRRYGNQGGTWEQAAPAYELGFNARRNPDYAGKDWASIEPEVRRTWERGNPTLPWEVAKAYARDAWDEAS